jgi:hypothetical protein
LAFCPAIFDGDVLAHDVTGISQTLAERGHVVRIGVGRPAVEKTDDRYRRVLRARRERLRCHCTADKNDELPSPHSTTLMQGDGIRITHDLVQGFAIAAPQWARVTYARKGSDPD